MRLHDSEACACESPVPWRRYSGLWLCRRCEKLVPAADTEIVRPFAPAGWAFGDGRVSLSDRRWGNRIDPAAWEQRP